MALSRLENFLKSSRGKILHVNSENLDATDSITNDGSSPFVPFKTLQRALIEASRYSYQIGFDNDRFNFCTILLYPGEYLIDNRPGLIINDSGIGYLRSGATATLSQFDLTTILDITDENNKLYLLNSVDGGVIVPRGTSIIAQDPRKTVLRPLYVPDSKNDDIERSAIFRITGASFFWSFSIEDADPTGFCYKNYNTSKYTPNFSHHKLTAFEYVDGVNDVKIKDTFLDIETTRTDLEQYYEKVSLVYGASSGREIDSVNYIGGVSVDIQPIIDEYRIVGPRGEVIGISSITSGDGITPSPTITVTLDKDADGISVDTSVQVSGVNETGYDGQFVVSAVPSTNQIQYITSTVPTIAQPLLFGATLNIISDTVSSASPYIFNVLLKSVYGMCGLHADGSKVIGFKSVVVAQFTAISLQKDDDAFVIYDEESGNYLDATVVKDLYKNTRSKYKPEFQGYHIKLSNDAFAQLVSVFSIGYAAQIIAEGGGDYSITNSNSNFGAKTFISSGFKKDAFDQDDHGFIVGVIPPEEIESKIIGVEFPQIDVGLTTTTSAGAATTNRLYFYNETDLDNPPTYYKDGFRIGAKINDRLNIENPEIASSRIAIPGTNVSYENSFTVQRQNNGFQNSIEDGVFTLTIAHNFGAEEKVRVISENGHLPDGISDDTVYYVINSTIDNSLSNAQIKLAVTKNNAINNVAILPNKKGGKLFVVSRVSDKVPGDPGHPIQWDSLNSNWYINVVSSDNGIYDEILNTGSTVTGRTFIERTPDNRKEENKLYKILYCIPKNTTTAARPPVNGFILQESNDSSLSGTEFERYFGDTDLAVDTEIRNPKFISTVSWSSGEVTAFTELVHKLNVGDVVEVDNVIPVGYNGTFTVTKTSSSRSFSYELVSDPGVFTNDTRVRNSNLPYVKRKKSRNIFRVFKSEETQKFIRNKQDGLYKLTVVHTSVKPTIEPFTANSFSQPIQNLYPRLDRDNPNSDPNQTSCFAEHNIIGNVLVDDVKNSISKEAVNKFNSDLNVGIGITSIISNNVGTAHTIYTDVEHGLSGITGISLVSAGSSYITGTYYGVGTATTFNGQSASFRVVVDASQSITEVEIMSSGSNYFVGDTVSVVSGIGTTTGFVAAVLGITSVAPVSNKVISLSNYVGDFVGYNNSYVISGINGPKVINVSSASTIVGFSTIAVNYNSLGSISGEVISISSFTYDNISGIATATTTGSHGIKVNTKIRLSGFNSIFYNRDVYISSVNSLTQIELDLGKSSTSPPTTGTRVIIPLGIGPVDSKSRLTYYYSDIKSISGTTLSVSASELIPFEIVNARNSGLKKGDYIESNGEIMRIRGRIDSSFVDVYRAQLGSERKDHPTGSVVRKINVVPVEFRRNSIIRASGHTFEYVGYGAGNYSTSLPENQDREIERDERLISQSTKDAGGTVYYGGMDENGDFYSANRKFSSSTGEQQVYDLPIPTVVSESSIEESLNIVETEKALVTGSMRVDGGENNDIISQFNGPIVLNKKLTSYSQEGIEATSLFLKGDQKVSRRYTISDTTPDFAGNYGDIVYRATPTEGENIGWIYTLQDEWRTWGYVGNLGTQIFLYSGGETGALLTPSGTTVPVITTYNNLTVRGSLYYPTSNFIGPNIDVIVLYHGSIEQPGVTPTTAASDALNIFINSSRVNIRDKIIFSVAYPQDAIPSWIQNNSLISQEYPELLGNYGNYSNFLFGDNIEYAEAALLWVKNNLNGYLSSIGLAKTINRVFTFGHSQGGYLVHRLNTMHPVDGAISNSPGPIDLLARCSSSEAQGNNNTACAKIRTSLGSTSTSPQSYNDISLKNFLSGTLSPALFTQALDDTTGNASGVPQVANMQNIVQPGLESCINCSSVQFNYYNSGGHAAFVTNVAIQQDIRDFVGSVPFYSGTNNLEGIVDKLKFIGDSTGFGIDVDIQVDPSAGFGTIILKNPIDIINFGNTILGLDVPKFTNRSTGTRVVYQNVLNDQNVDYAVGVSNNILWNSIPRNEEVFAHKWFAGETEIMSLSGTGKLSVSNGIIATILGDVDGNATTATTATNLTRSITAGAGLGGGGQLTQDITLDIGDGDGITVNADGVSVDGTVVRTSGNQTIAGTKTFSESIVANLLGNATSSAISGGVVRTIFAGAGLGGGGQLTQDITLAIGGGDGITVNADGVQVDATVVRTSGSQTIAGTKTFSNTISGNISGNSGTTSDATVVRTSGSQTIAGTKTFSNTISGNISGNSGTTSDDTVVRTTGAQDISGIKIFNNSTGFNTNARTPGLENTVTGVTIESLGAEGGAIFISRDSVTQGLFINKNTNSSAVRFSRSGIQVGDIVVTSSGTSYNITSDYRLKENVVDLGGAINRLKNLPVRRFNFISDPHTVVDGFIAHEAQEVVPECATGTKDGVEVHKNVVLSSDGKILFEGVSREEWEFGKLPDINNEITYPTDSIWVEEHTTPIYQGIDQSKLVPLLTAALKEAIEKIEILEQEVSSLKQHLNTK